MENTQLITSVDTLKNVDFSTVDMIVIMYDLNDYMDDRPVMDENNDINLITWNGALNASMRPKLPMNTKKPANVKSSA